jgi:TRAP-type C4-dicarboxylate transport system permease small subunit
VFSRNPALFNRPIPGHLELSELLMPPTIYLAISYTQATGGHVRMTLLIDLLNPRLRAGVEIVVRVLSIGICAILSYYSGKHALRVWRFGDVTMSPPYFVVWPSAIMAPVGLFLVTLRQYLEVLHLVAPKLLPASEPGLVSTSTAE